MATIINTETVDELSTWFQLRPPDGLKLPAVHYESNAGQSIPDSTLTIVNFEDLVYDTHSAVTIGAAWNFAVPTGWDGIYSIDAIVHWNSIDPQEGEEYYLRCHVNGANVGYLEYHSDLQTASSRIFPLGGHIELDLDAGDTVDVRVYQGSGGAETLRAVATYNRIQIHWIRPPA